MSAGSKYGRRPRLLRRIQAHLREQIESGALPPRHVVSPKLLAEELRLDIKIVRAAVDDLVRTGELECNNDRTRARRYWVAGEVTEDGTRRSLAGEAGIATRAHSQRVANALKQDIVKGTLPP